MKYKLTLVNYINTLPFLEALPKSGSPFIVSEKIPKQCGVDFINGAADIALLPCGFLPSLEPNSYTVLDKFGIACNGAVRTVKLLSNQPIESIKHIALDNHSTSSSKLLEILCAHHWKINPVFDTIRISEVDDLEAVLMIGDKVFEYESKFKYAFDLGHEWKAFTGLPFVFAIWVAKSNVPKSIIDQLNTMLNQGILDLDQTIEKYSKHYPHLDIETYLGDFIHFRLDPSYLSGLQHFLQLVYQQDSILNFNSIS